KVRSSDDFTSPRIAEIAKELKLLEQNRKIEVLKNRKDEDLFLKQLAQLREEEARLKGLNLDLSALTLARVDQPAVQPLKPERPKKLLIIAIGLVMGGVIGMMVALIRWELRKHKS